MSPKIDTPEAEAMVRRGCEIARDVMLRDQFAMMSLSGMLARPNSTPQRIPGVEAQSYEHYARSAYQQADAMLKAREL